MQTTWRYHNNEYTSLNTPYDTCAVQGISVGWGDDYIAGLDCQWIDVTNSTNYGWGKLEETLNPDLFLCEGTPVTDAAGKPQFVQTNFTFGPKNEPVYRGACNFTPSFDQDNVNGVEVFLNPKGSFVTDKCSRYQLGEKRDCGFMTASASRKTVIRNAQGSKEIRMAPFAGAYECRPNTTVKISLSLVPKPGFQTVTAAYIRVCEASRKLGQVIACEYVFALGSLTLSAALPSPTLNGTISFNCPASRPETGEGNLYGFLVSDYLKQIPVNYM